MASVDVTVRGAGAFGLCIAWEAARRGAKVRVIEAQRIGAGSSGGLVGALSPHVPENWNPKKQFQLESLLMADAFWSAVEQVSGLSTGFGRFGRLQVLPNAAAVDLAQKRHKSAQSLWSGRAIWQVVPVSGTEWEPVSPSGWLVHDTLSARLHPRLAAGALVAAIRAKGGEVIEGLGLEEGLVVWATGLQGLRDLSADLGRQIGDGVKGQAISIGFNAPNLPQIYADGLHIIPHVDGTVAIGSTSEHVWQTESGTDAQLDTLLDRAVAALPILAGAPVRERWAGVRPRAKTKSPILGAWPGRPGHFVANGGFKIGFGMAPKVATTLVDLVLEGRDTIPDGFRL